VRAVDVRRAVSAAGRLRTGSAAAVGNRQMNVPVSLRECSETCGKTDGGSGKNPKVKSSN